MRKSRFTVWLLLGSLIGILAGTAASFLLPTQYESTAGMQVVPCQVPERFGGAVPAAPIQQSLPQITEHLLSRGVLTVIIQSYDLYPQERGKLPMEDVIEGMREDVRVWTQSEGSHTTIHLSFRYRDPVLARKVTIDFAQRLIDQYFVSQSAYHRLTVQFLRDTSDTAARDWLALKQVKGTDAGGSERRALDLELARKHYESIRQKLNEAEVVDSLLKRRQGEHVELTDLPPLEAKPVSLRRSTFIAIGAVGGLLAGFLFVFVKRPG